MEYKTGNSRNVNSSSIKKLESNTFIIVALFIAALASRVRDLDGGKEEKSGRDDMALVTLSLSTPVPPTRANVAGSEDENKVAGVDVLLFTKDDDKLYYRASAGGSSITGENPSPYQVKTFTVRLPINPIGGGSTPGPYRMVIVANARALPGSHAPNTILSGPTRQVLLNGLARSVAAGTKLAYPFPMWGEHAAELVITATSPPSSLDVTLTRAVARVDVSLDTDVLNFTLDSVILYNYRDAGHVAPEVITAGTYSSACYPAGSKTPGTFLGYAISESVEPAKGFLETIYAFEAANVALSNSNWKENTCLVVGGRFGSSSSNITYYRVEFVDDSNAPLDLTRNHLYNVLIDEVKAAGWPTPWHAYVNKPSNIVVQITEWNDGGTSETLFNGQYSLTVNKSHLEFYSAFHYSKLTTVDLPVAKTIGEQAYNQCRSLTTVNLPAVEMIGDKRSSIARAWKS